MPDNCARPHQPDVMNMMRKFAVPFILLAAVLAGPAAFAQATKSPDFIAGEQAYRRGDVRGAMNKLRPLADAGDSAAQAMLGEILDRAEQDEEAVKYFRKSAELGNADGAYGLATMLAAGEGGPKNPAMARSWFEKAAATGHEGAVKSLAAAYLIGGLDISKEGMQSMEAYKWIRAAADANVVPAVDRLAKAYRKGEWSLPVDIKAAEALEAKSLALQGLTPTKGKKNAPKKQ